MGLTAALEEEGTPSSSSHLTPVRAPTAASHAVQSFKYDEDVSVADEMDRLSMTPGTLGLCKYRVTRPSPDAVRIPVIKLIR